MTKVQENIWKELITRGRPSLWNLASLKLPTTSFAAGKGV